MKIAVVSSVSKGHDGFPPTIAVSGSPNYTVGGLSVLRVGDPFVPHTNGDSTHGLTVLSGSPNYFVNDIAVARVSDPLSCGDLIDTGQNMEVN